MLFLAENCGAGQCCFIASCTWDGLSTCQSLPHPDAYNIPDGQAMLQMRQREEEKLASARSGGFDGMLGAVGQGMIRARKDVDPQVYLSTCSVCRGFWQVNVVCAEAPLAQWHHASLLCW